MKRPHTFKLAADVSEMLTKASTITHRPMTEILEECVRVGIDIVLQEHHKAVGMAIREFPRHHKHKGHLAD